MKIVTYIIILIFSSQIYAGKISSFKKELKNSSNSSYSRNNDLTDEDVQFFFYLLEFMFRVMILPSDEDNGFVEYPYDNENDKGIYDSNSNKLAMAKISMNYFHSNQLKGIDLSMKLALTGIGLRVDITNLYEKDNRNFKDSIKFSNIFLNLYSLRTSNVVAWIGAGSKSIDSNFKFALDIGTEIFIMYPISLYIDYNVGFFHNLRVKELDVSMNIYSGRYFLKVGYHNFFLNKNHLGGATIGVGGTF